MDPTNPRILYAAIWQAQRYPHALISGGEESGLRPGVVRKLDRRLRIPMSGRVESLNVAAAAAVLLFDAARSRIQTGLPPGD